MAKKKVTLIAKIDFYSHGGKFLRLTSRSVGIEQESLEYHAEDKIIKALGLERDDTVKVTFEKLKRN